MYRSVWGTVMVFFTAAASCIGCAVFRRRSTRFTLFSDYVLLNIPLFGVFIKAVQTMDFAFAMEMLTGAGIHVHTALRETAAVVRNRAYGKALVDVHAMLLKGETLSAAFGGFREFPPYIATWIAVGERTGAVESVFTQIREYFQEDVDAMSEKLMGLLEPCLILVVGIMVLMMILQFVLPIFSLYGRLL
jgi:type II secretory pathway component PulF